MRGEVVMSVCARRRLRYRREDDLDRVGCTRTSATVTSRIRSRGHGVIP